MEILRQVNISSDDEYVELINKFSCKNRKSLDYCKKNNWCLYCRAHEVCDQTHNSVNCDIGCYKCCPMVYAVMRQKERYIEDNFPQEHIIVPTIQDYCIDTVYSRNGCCCPFCCNDVYFSLNKEYFKDYDGLNVESLICIISYIYNEINDENIIDKFHHEIKKTHNHESSDRYLSKSLCTILLCMMKFGIPHEIISTMAVRLFYPFIKKPNGAWYEQHSLDSLKLVNIYIKNLTFSKANNWCLYCRNHIVCDCDYGCRVCCPFIKTAIKTIRDNCSYNTDDRGVNSILVFNIKSCKRKNNHCNISLSDIYKHKFGFEDEDEEELCCPYCCQLVMFEINRPTGMGEVNYSIANIIRL